MKRYLKILLIIMTCFILGIGNVEAKSYIKDLFQTGDNISVDKELNGTAFIAGNKVELNSKIDGIGFIAGNELNINYDQDYMFGAGATININNNIEKDVFLAGEKVNIKETSNLNRDAYIFANTVNIEGSIERNVYVYSTTVNIKGTIKGNIVVSATEVNIDENAKILGTLKYDENAVIEGIREDIKTKTYKIETNEITFKEYATKFISSYIHIVLLAIVLVFMCENLFKKSLKQTEELNANKILILCGKGFLILIGVPIIAMMLLISGIFVSVGVIGAIIYGILIYISTIFTGYLLANTLDKKYFKKNMNSYLLVIIGIFIIHVISIIPYIGGIVSFLSILLGLGITGNMIIEMKK